MLQANSTAISGLSLGETGNTTTSGETFTLVLSDTNGVLNSTAGGTQSNSGHTLTITGSLGTVNTDLAALTDTDTNAAADTINVTASDSFGNSAAAAAIAVSVTPLTPKLSAPTSATVTEGTATAISGVSLAETSNVAGETFTVVLSDTNGVLNSTAGGTQSNSGHTLTIAGSLSTVNTDLAALSDDDASTAADTINVTASDSLGNSAAAAAIAVTVTPSGAISWAAAASGSWNTASNWNPATVPGAANQADIGVAGTYTVTSSQNNAVGSLDISDSSAILAITTSSTFTIGDQPASQNAGTILVSNGSSLDLDAGTFTNSGEIAVAATSPSVATLGISGSVTLNGSGSILLANVQNSIVGLASGASLTNVNNTIVGAGTVGNSSLTLTNEGTIESHLGTLTVNTGSNTIANTGTLGSVDGDLVVDSSVSGTGKETISTGGTLEFAGGVSSGQTVTFANKSGDTLKLDAAQNFSGTLSGLAAASSTSFDTVDLANFKFADTTITSVSGTGAVGTTTNVTLTDSADDLVVTLHLLNQSANQFGTSASDYSLTSDGSATPGTNFSVDYTPGTRNQAIGGH